eukprot:CAMPEP_0197832636 /NCGR_PEP_ID=MMETSP1437-20131217/15337_1 /TAXON_ID=49252 ORGANISM="Eucampia antarctica, Strain CCMP1452" /NCGR_SAMPLE_ID=MMETSP1437 /ASSEMBLY_ACC=CAM_ASM_001096 /LENGTH=373 /DNA_ID=CAMNT_0043436091 /DNA_START=44 /DNA_END=1165 /DNA_ORIENTATION=+
MMDAIVQFVRNALCCIKDLELYSETFLHDPSYTKSYYHFHEPLDKTTPIEIVISLTQLYAFVSVSLAGYELITSAGVYKLRRLTRIAGYIGSVSGSNSVSNKLIRNSIAYEADAAIRSVFIGSCVLPIGISFFWLFANSLHITEAGWIGGLPALILALSVMEIVLVPLLYYMIKDAEASIRKSQRMKILAKNITIKANSVSLDLETYCLINDSGWEPFWAGNASFSEKVASLEKQMFEKEVTNVTKTVDSLLSGKDGYNFTKAFNRTAEEISTNIQSNASITKWEGYREYFYFIVNFIAFYGYLMGIICYLYDNVEVQPTFVTFLKFKHSNTDADWTGNFAGDLMWTVEPIVILSSPLMLSFMKPKIVKPKSD